MARHFPFAVSWGAWIFIKIDADANLINNIPRARNDAFLIQSIHIQSYWLLFILNFGKRLDSSTCFTKGGEAFYIFMDIQLSIPPPIHSILRRLMRSLLIDAITEIYESTRKSLMNNFAPAFVERLRGWWICVGMIFIFGGTVAWKSLNTQRCIVVLVNRLTKFDLELSARWLTLCLIVFCRWAWRLREGSSHRKLRLAA